MRAEQWAGRKRSQRKFRLIFKETWSFSAFGWCPQMNVHPILSLFSFHDMQAMALQCWALCPDLLVVVPSEPPSLGWAWGWQPRCPLPCLRGMPLALAKLSSQHLALTCHTHSAYLKARLGTSLKLEVHWQRARAQPARYLLLIYVSLAYTWLWGIKPERRDAENLC